MVKENNILIYHCVTNGYSDDYLTNVVTMHNCGKDKIFFNIVRIDTSRINLFPSAGSTGRNRGWI